MGQRERTVSTNGVELHVVEAGAGPTGRPRATASPSSPTRGATRSRRSPPPATASLAPDQRGYGRSSPARGDRGLRHPPPHRRPARPARRPRRASRRSSSATTGARWSSGSWRCSHPERVAGRRRHERAVPAARADAAGAADAPGLRRHLLLHPLLPGARRRRRRPRRATPRDDDAPHARGRRRSTEDADARPVGHGRRRARLRRPHARARRPARLAEPGRARPLRRRVRPAPASPAASTGTATSTATGSSRPQLAGAKVHGAVAVHRRRARPGADDDAARR